MQVSQRAAGTEGIVAALVAMETELNLALLDGMGFTPPVPVGANDLLVALRAHDDALAAGLAVVAEALAARPSAGRGSFAVRPPRTVSSAARLTGPASP